MVPHCKYIFGAMLTGSSDLGLALGESFRAIRQELLRYPQILGGNRCDPIPFLFSENASAFARIIETMLSTIVARMVENGDNLYVWRE